MKPIISKYEFNSKEQFLNKVDALHTRDEEGNLIPNFKFAFVQLGHIALEQGKFDIDGNELKKPVLSKKYHIDAAWFIEDLFDEQGILQEKDHPYGWKSYSVDSKIKEGQGMHSFMGIDYQKNKF